MYIVLDIHIYRCIYIVLDFTDVYIYWFIHLYTYTHLQIRTHLQQEHHMQEHI